MVAESVLSAIDDERLAVYVVWMPVLGADTRAAALEARATVGDSRASHFWDPDQSVGRAFGRSLDLPRGGELAWDAYLVFGPDAEWGAALPDPTVWNHQLGFGPLHLGDGSALRAAIEALTD